MQRLWERKDRSFWPLKPFRGKRKREIARQNKCLLNGEGRNDQKAFAQKIRPIYIAKEGSGLNYKVVRVKDKVNVPSRSFAMKVLVSPFTPLRLPKKHSDFSGLKKFGYQMWETNTLENFWGERRKKLGTFL